MRKSTQATPLGSTQRVRALSLRPASKTTATLAGHAVEFCINAEDPKKDFLPSPGEVMVVEVPAPW